MVSLLPRPCGRMAGRDPPRASPGGRRGRTRSLRLATPARYRALRRGRRRPWFSPGSMMG